MRVLGEVELSELGVLILSFLGLVHSHCGIL